ncbi:MAG: AMP-binding protein [Alphaproteobacteria bacterium]
MSTPPPFRKVNFVPPRLHVERREDGAIILRNDNPMDPPPRNVIEPLRQWAEETPGGVWLGERDGQGEWRHLTFGGAARTVNAVAQALIDRGLHEGGPDHGPLMILSGNSIEHALMTYGAIAAGMPVAPVSRAYSLMSADHAKLKYVYDLIRPRMLFVQDGTLYEKALRALDLDGVEVVCVENPPGTIPATDYTKLTSTAPGPEVDNAYERLTHETVAKYLFTSGSTGMPKAVINTHGMMCVNSRMVRATQHRGESDEFVLLSWLPWNHTFGGNALLNTTLAVGGTLYLDGGLPVPGKFDETLRNLREIAPTAYSNVPAAYAMLAPELERDEALARNFFSRLKLLSYGAAALSGDIYERIQRVAVRTTGERIMFSSGYGATETAPTITSVHWETDRVGLIGLPLPGVELKLAPVGGKYEVRARGPAITPGYYGRPDLTEAAFDEEGFYRLGDAAKFVDPERPEAGLVFDGRVAEDFKLATGTWVNAGKLRLEALSALDGLAQDALVAGQDRPFVALLIWPNLAAARELTGEPDLTPEAAVVHPLLLERVREGLARHNERHQGSSTRIARALLMAEPPDMDAGEITDKGYVNQRRALERRAHLVNRLYEERELPEATGAGRVIVAS